MALSARNQLAGTVVSIRKGAVNAEVVVALPGRQSIVSMITLESVKRLKLRKGARVKAVIKSSDVMIATD